jgi:hypothetical protein
MSSYEEPGRGTHEQAQPQQPPQHTPSPPDPAFELRDITPAGWGVLASSLLTFVFSFLPWWSWSFSWSVLGLSYSSSGSASGWHRFWFLGVLAGVAAGVLHALNVMKVIAAHRMTLLLPVYAGLAAFVLTVISLIDTARLGYDATSASTGPSFGAFLALAATAALSYFTALTAQQAGVRLPFTVPELVRR